MRKQTTEKTIINGLVVLGGRSMRMGEDKAEIQYHGIPQREHLAQLLSRFTKTTFISCRQEQIGQIDTAYPLLPDINEGIGPMAAIISAQKYKPRSAWLAVAIDFPLIDSAAINFLLNNRDATKAATTFRNPITGSPEPLLTIWEPSSHDEIIKAFDRKNYSLRRVLNQLDAVILDFPNAMTLKNVNLPEDRTAVLHFLRQKKRR